MWSLGYCCNRGCGADCDGSGGDGDGYDHGDGGSDRTGSTLFAVVFADVVLCAATAAGLIFTSENMHKTR